MQTRVLTHACAGSTGLPRLKARWKQTDCYSCWLRCRAKRRHATLAFARLTGAPPLLNRRWRTTAPRSLPRAQTPRSGCVLLLLEERPAMLHGQLIACALLCHPGLQPSAACAARRGIRGVPECGPRAHRA
jgi:hypothetical protein